MKNYKVAIIDDEVLTIDTIIRLCDWSALHMQLAGTATDGASGFNLIVREKPDIVITDMKMPRQDGAELLASLSKHNLKPKIIVVSAFIEYSYISQAINSQVISYLLKPIKPHELNEKLKKCAEELDRESDSTLLLINRVTNEWLNEFNAQFTILESCLDEKNKKGIELVIKKLSDMTAGQEDQIIDAVTTKIKFNFDHAIERFIISHSIETTSEFESVISSSNKNVFENYLELFCDLIDSKNTMDTHKNRLDIEKIKNTIQTRYAESLSLQSLAQESYVSKEYLSLAFKRETGMNFSKYLSKVRMEKAYELIAAYNMPIKKVAELTGFYDLSHFYRSFKRQFGITPAEIKVKSDNTAQV